MSACLEATLWPSASRPPTDARAARMVTFERERLIVDCLDCGVFACWSLLREAQRYVAVQPEGREVRPAASAGAARPSLSTRPLTASTPPPPCFEWSPSPALARRGGKGGDASPPPWSECGMGEGDRPKDGGGGRAATELGVARARKFQRKPLKRLNPRPGIRRALSPPRPLVPTSRSRFGPPPRQATRARKSRRKPLKRLNPRPGNGRLAEAAARLAAKCRHRLTPARARSRSPSGPSNPSAGRRVGRCSGRDRRRRRRRRGSRGCGRSA